MATAMPIDTALEVAVRCATADDAPAIFALIEANLADGHLLPRPIEELRRRAPRFLLVEDQETVVACAELAPLSRLVAEVRSLVVDAAYRGRGLGGSLIRDLEDWARREGFATLCAFTHEPSHFVRLGFSIVPHPWIPEKITTDCVGCPKFRSCGQYAVALSLPAAQGAAPSGRVASSSLPPHSRSTVEPLAHVLVLRS